MFVPRKSTFCLKNIMRFSLTQAYFILELSVNNACGPRMLNKCIRLNYFHIYVAAISMFQIHILWRRFLRNVTSKEKGPFFVTPVGKWRQLAMTADILWQQPYNNVSHSCFFFYYIFLAKFCWSREIVLSRNVYKIFLNNVGSSKPIDLYIPMDKKVK